MTTQEFKYSHLSQEEGLRPSVEDINEGPSVNGSVKRTKLDALVRISILIVLGCSVFDTLCFLYLATSSRREDYSLAFDDLPARSSYIGLDKLYSNTSTKSSKLAPITNLPHFVGHVDSSKPDQTSSLWTKLWASQDGMVPYDERRTMVTSTISTIVQFHVIDFGMEHCSPRMSIPAGRGDAAAVPDFQVDVWVLNRDRLLRAEELSWNTKPSRKQFLGTFSGAPNSTQSLPGFDCKSGTYYVFELSCRTGDCNLHVHTTGRRIQGFYIIQHQTI